MGQDKIFRRINQKSKIIVLRADYNSNEGPILNEKEINRCLENI